MRPISNNLTLRQLRAYVTVARNRSFIASAKELFITPSALSETIRQLEEDLGVRLLDRTTRSVEMTAAGKEFFADITQLLESLELSTRRMNDLGSARSGLVRVTGVASILARLTAPCVAKIAHHNPGIAFEIVEDGTSNILSSVLEGSADIGVGVVPEDVPAGLHAQRLVTDRYGIVAKKGHPALSLPRLTVRSLEGWDCIGVPLGGEPAHMLENSISPRIQLNNFGALVPLLEAGAGFSILPFLGAERILSRNLAFKAFIRPVYVRHVYAVRKQSRSLSPAAKLLWDAMTDRAPVLLLERLDSAATMFVDVAQASAP